ncbi:MAG: glycosyltransferase, partial [Actinomycetota bacterium]|nr:glycosyltransferase [Actinomycetota bacterium]
RRLIAELGAEWVHEIVSLQDGPLVTALRADGRRVTVIDVPPRPPGLVTRSFALRNHLRSIGARLVHANGIKAALVCTTARVGAATRVLWVKHDFSFEGAFASSIGACVDRVVGVSRASIAGLRGPAARKATFVHTGIDHVDADRERARSALVEELGWPSDAFVVGAVGRLDPAKGHRELIRAVAEARDRIPNVHVVVAGAVDPNHPRTKERLEVAGREHAIGDRLAVLDDCDDVRSL